MFNYIFMKYIRAYGLFFQSRWFSFPWSKSNRNDFWFFSQLHSFGKGRYTKTNSKNFLCLFCCTKLPMHTYLYGFMLHKILKNLIANICLTYLVCVWVFVAYAALRFGLWSLTHSGGFPDPWHKGRKICESPARLKRSAFLSFTTGS